MKETFTRQEIIDAIKKQWNDKFARKCDDMGDEWAQGHFKVLEEIIRDLKISKEELREEPKG